jgi:hypothetical protein
MFILINRQGDYPTYWIEELPDLLFLKLFVEFDIDEMAISLPLMQDKRLLGTSVKSDMAICSMLNSLWKRETSFSREESL